MAKSKADLLGACKRRYTECEGYRIQSLTDHEWSDWESKRVDYSKGKADREQIKASRRRLIVKCLVDDDGARLFSDSEADSLKDVDSAIAGKLFDACMDHCGYDADDEGVEDLEKN